MCSYHGNFGKHFLDKDGQRLTQIHLPIGGLYTGESQDAYWDSIKGKGELINKNGATYRGNFYRKCDPIG